LSKAKPFCISKRVVFEAYKRVKANQGAAGVDEESIADFDKDVKNNLYKIWNRMSSAAIFRQRYDWLRSPKRAVVKESWACQRYQIGSHRW